jgi:hypothetical protein
LQSEALGSASLSVFVRSARHRISRMNVNEINAYLQQAREIIGDRSPSEIAYDDSVVAHLSRGMDIKRAIRATNREHPKEALEPGPEHWPDLAARYEYIMEHKAILKTLGMTE